MGMPCGLKHLHLDSYGLQIFQMETIVSLNAESRPVQQILSS